MNSELFTIFIQLLFQISKQKYEWSIKNRSMANK
jgi:hypothetical protein